jgi:hypothetical protein
MKGEMFVVKLLQLSSRAQAAAAQLLGTASEEEQIERIREADFPERMKRDKGWESDEVFDRVAEALQKRCLTAQKTRFSLEHLRRLLDEERLTPLAAALGCDRTEAVRNLLDVRAIRKTIQSVDEQVFREAGEDPRFLLFNITNASFVRRIEQNRIMQGWDQIVRDEKWIQKSAAAKLLAYAESEGWKATDASEVVARLLSAPQRATANKLPTGTSSFDAYGVNWLRQRIVILTGNLREQAFAHVREAASLAPHRRELLDLEAWIAIYDLGKVVQTLPHFIARKKVLRELLRSARTQKSAAEGTPVADKELVVSAESTYTAGLFRKTTLGTFEVRCFLDGHQEAVPILTCRDVPETVYRHLCKELPTIRGSQISATGDTPANRILNTSVLEPEPFSMALGQAIRDLGPRFIQCLIVSGIRLDGFLRAPWQEDLSKELPFTVPKNTEQDSDFPLDVYSILKDLQKRHPGAEVV